ncbi:MAG: class I SAM-dependent methyltransferase [Desulfamplus sp.]|nr:class I SAM-dependent methyltransferase [Desulfamplus sp.]
MESNINDAKPANPDNPEELEKKRKEYHAILMIEDELEKKLVKNPVSAELWDAWWSIKRKKENYLINIIQDEVIFDYINNFIKNGVKTVLLAGNGFSQQPKMFSYSGFDVTVIDISPYANSYALNCKFHPERYTSEWVNSSSNKKTIKRLPKRIGGSLEFITGDFMNPAIFDNKRFDVIISFRTLQHYSGDLLEKACLSLVSSLNPNGFLLIGITGYNGFGG